MPRGHAGGASGCVRLFALVLLTAAIVCPIAATAADALAIEVAAAEPGYDRIRHQPFVILLMTDASRLSFAAFSERNVGRQVDFRVDGRTVMTPIIREPIRGGRLTIVGAASVGEAKELARHLTSGAVKVEVEVIPDRRLDDATKKL